MSESTRREDVEDRPTGTVKCYNEQKGYGFIIPDEGGNEIFFHARDSLGDLATQVGNRVEFYWQWNIRGNVAERIEKYPRSRRDEDIPQEPTARRVRETDSGRDDDTRTRPKESARQKDSLSENDHQWRMKEAQREGGEDAEEGWRKSRGEEKKPSARV